MNRPSRNLLLAIPLLALLVLLSQGCGSSQPFTKLAPMDDHRGALYLLRPVEGAFSARGFTFRIYSYPNHFTKSLPVLYRELDLYENDYAMLYLEPGFYRIELTDFEDTFKIIHIDAGKISYISLRFFGGDVFSAPDALLVELAPDDAVMQLISDPRMERMEESEDPLPGPDGG